MRLDSARLCLDCEELHEDQICPACGSEAFAFVRRWIQPAIEQKGDRTMPARPSAAVSATAELRDHAARTPEQIEAYRQLIEGRPAPRRGNGLLAKGVLGLAAFSLAGWAWRSASKAPRFPARDAPPESEGGRRKPVSPKRPRAKGDAE